MKYCPKCDEKYLDSAYYCNTKDCLNILPLKHIEGSH